jgi:hypothetical protein
MGEDINLEILKQDLVFIINEKNKIYESLKYLSSKKITHINK